MLKILNFLLHSYDFVSSLGMYIKYIFRNIKFFLIILLFILGPKLVLLTLYKSKLVFLWIINIKINTHWLNTQFLHYLFLHRIRVHGVFQQPITDSPYGVHHVLKSYLKWNKKID